MKKTYMTPKTRVNLIEAICICSTSAGINHTSHDNICGDVKDENDWDMWSDDEF